MYARRLSPQVIELLAPNQISVQAVAMMGKEADGLGKASVYLLDVSFVNGFDRNALPLVMKTLQYAKPKRIVVIAPGLMKRVLIEAGMSNSPVPVEIWDDRESGLASAGVR